MLETNGDVKKCPRCHILENRLRAASEALRLERIARGEREGFEDYDELLNRFASVYNDMPPGAEVRARINLLPMRAKIDEAKARTEKIKIQTELTEAQKKMTEAKTEKIALENEEKREMIQLYQAAIQAVERLGAGQAVEADFEVIDQLKEIGVRISPKIKSAAFLLKQTNGGQTNERQ